MGKGNEVCSKVAFLFSHILFTHFSFRGEAKTEVEQSASTRMQGRVKVGRRKLAAPAIL